MVNARFPLARTTEQHAGDERGTSAEDRSSFCPHAVPSYGSRLLCVRRADERDSLTPSSHTTDNDNGYITCTDPIENAARSIDKPCARDRRQKNIHECARPSNRRRRIALRAYTIIVHASRQGHESAETVIVLKTMVLRK